VVSSLADTGVAIWVDDEADAELRKPPRVMTEFWDAALLLPILLVFRPINSFT
jgi:hypothetical protein